jgi:hypothetical protein
MIGPVRACGCDKEHFYLSVKKCESFDLSCISASLYLIIAFGVAFVCESVPLNPAYFAA